MKLRVGSKAPDFVLPDQDGKKVKLSGLRGKKVLVYFYPKDDTPGCTKEACGMRDEISSFKDHGVVVLGISVDGTSSHKKFAEKYKLPFNLLADEEKKAASAYGVWVKKTFMGRTYMGTQRASFLIDEDGRIAKIYDKVKPEAHAKEVLGDAKGL